MLPEDAVSEWLVSYLGSDGELMGMLNGDIAPEVRPGSFASPMVRIDYLDGSDLNAVGAQRVWADSTYHIRGAYHWQGGGRPDRTEVNAIGARLDELLHDHAEFTATLEIESFREEPEPQPAVLEPDGRLWLQSGGVYRIRARVP
jgi:hypothetical protein